MLKYLVFVLIILLLIKYNPNTHVSDEVLFTLLVGAMAFIFFWNLYGKTEGFTFPQKMIQQAIPGINFGVPQNIKQEDVSGTIPKESIPVTGISSCGSGPIIPNPYLLNHRLEDIENTGLNYNNNSGQFHIGNPAYRLAQGDSNFPNFGTNVSSTSPTPLSDLTHALGVSKTKRLFQQHNHVMRWTPHTHIGKARGRLNWDHLYPN